MARAAATRTRARTVDLVLVSACLLGEPVRYNGGDSRCDHHVLQRWVRERRVLPFCPEVAGGLPVPRHPAEITKGAGGSQVLTGEAAVVDSCGQDVSAGFVAGATAALELAQAHALRVAVLKEGSPSCGSGAIYDGTFTGVRVQGLGVTAALLRQAGIQVFSEAQLHEAESLVLRLEAGGVV